MSAITSILDAIRTMRTRSFLIVVLMSAIGPAIATADPVNKCLQRELRAAGHNPRGIDGIIGPNTRAAAASWAQKTDAELPDLDDETAIQWCAAILSTQANVPAPAPGTERYCIWFKDVLSGVWFDLGGKPSMRFRYASQGDGAGCYAWLNPVPDWGIIEPGTQILRVAREDNLWSSGDEENGIFVDTETGLAKYVQNGVTSFGVLLENPTASGD